MLIKIPFDKLSRIETAESSDIQPLLWSPSGLRPVTEILPQSKKPETQTLC